MVRRGGDAGDEVGGVDDSLGFGEEVGECDVEGQGGEAAGVEPDAAGCLEGFEEVMD